tara:strand:+ start:771 stop:1427 length:657 start_codon:yes stop_codon:yes gene_type:complete
MGYLPKSKHIKSQTSGNEYFDPSTGQAYSGPIIITSEGVYKGKDVFNAGGRLFLYNENSNNKRKPKLNQIGAISTYHRLKSNLSEKINRTFNPVATKNIPTEKDYKKGYNIRYFVRRISTNTYFEVDKKTHKDLSSQNWKYDHNLFIPYSIKWALSGDVENINHKMLRKQEQTLPGISSLFPLLDEFRNKNDINIKTTTNIKKNPVQPRYLEAGSLEN